MDREEQIKRELLILAVSKRLGFKVSECLKFTNEELSTMLKMDSNGYF